MSDRDRVAALAMALGLDPAELQPEVALQAVRHGSYAHEQKPPSADLQSNERLEFLGDAVLGMAMSVHCWQRCPSSPEGELTRLRASLVRADTLAAVARQIGLGELLLLGRGEERGGGRAKPNLLADALEASLAAVYLSCGLPRVLEVVERLFGPLIDQAQAGAIGRDYKTELQERLQGRHRAQPQYEVVDAPGPQHARIFEVVVRFAGQDLGRGSGRTKKEAEQAAARAALASDLPPPTVPPPPEG